MRGLSLFFGLISISAVLAAADLRPVISRDAGKCAVAWEREDFRTIVAYMPARVVQRSGGRAALISELTNDFAQARSLGAERLEAHHGPPSIPKSIGRWLVSVIPVTAVVHSAHLDLTQETHVLALSEDRGKHWAFVLLYQATQAELNDWFPEFRGKVFVPTPPVPRVSIVY